jgi:glycyl-tRNA synthetase alpha chain
MHSNQNFQGMIANLQNYWSKQNCIIMQSLDTEVGAGTLHPATALKALENKPLRVAYVQASRRPQDGRYGLNPNRLQHYYQFQVLLKPSPVDIQQLCLGSLDALGIDIKKHDIRFVEDDWENPTIGAWGLGWEVWCDGMEVMQYTYMQQLGGVDIEIIPGELTYGLERLAMYVQDVGHFKDIIWNDSNDEEYIKKYGDLFSEDERQFSKYFQEDSSVEMLLETFKLYANESAILIDKKLPLPAYNYCLKACHCFNALEARGVISVTERTSYIAKIRNLARNCCVMWKEMANG